MRDLHAASDNDETTLDHYVQPLALHRSCPTRMLLRTPEGTFLLWNGSPDTIEQISPELASWVIDQSEMLALHRPLMWFALATLPTHAPETCTCSRQLTTEPPQSTDDEQHEWLEPPR